MTLDTLQISPDKVAHVVIRSRELDMKTDDWNEGGTLDQDDVTSENIIEDSPGDATRQELREFLQSLNEDELASLIALAWIGRGTYAPEEIGEAFSTAKSEHAGGAASYLLGLPLLPDYLEDALDQLGYSVEDAESAVLRPA